MGRPTQSQVERGTVARLWITGLIAAHGDDLDPETLRLLQSIQVEVGLGHLGAAAAIAKRLTDDLNVGPHVALMVKVLRAMKDKDAERARAAKAQQEERRRASRAAWEQAEEEFRRRSRGHYRARSSPWGKSDSSTTEDALRALGLDAVPRSEAELRRAYRAAAKRAHPDAGGSADQFLEIQQAMEALQLLHTFT